MRLLVTGGADGSLNPRLSVLQVGMDRTALPPRCQARNEPDPDRHKPEKANLVDSFFKCFTSFETWFFSRCDFQRLASLWVTAYASRTIGHRERTETNQYHRVASLQSASDGFDDCVQRTASNSFRDVSRCGDSINQFRLVHSKSPYIYMSLFLNVCKAKTCADWHADTF